MPYTSYFTSPTQVSPTDIIDTNYLIPSTAYFVSPAGLDTNTGRSPDSPTTVQNAVRNAPAGTTIVFRGGTYRGINKYGIKRKYILQAYPHEKVWIKGSILVTGWTQSGSIWRKDNWNYSFPPNVGSEYIDPAYPVAGYRDMVFTDGIALRQVTTIAEVEPGTFFVDSVAKKLYIGNNPQNAIIEIAIYDQAFTISKTLEFDPTSTTIRGLGFTHYINRALLIAAPCIQLEKNTIIWNATYGVKFEPASAGVSPISTDAILRGNTFSYNGRAGVSGDRAHRMLVENNTFSFNNTERFDQRFDAAGIKIVRTDGLVWRNNIVENNLGCGMWIDISSTNATVVHNLVRHNERYGIFFEISHSAIIASNIVHSNLTGVHLTNSSSAKIYNNTLSQNGHNLHIDDSNTRRNTIPEEIARGITWNSKNHEIKNNILSEPSPSFPDCLQFQATFDGTHANKMFITGDAVNNNIFYRSVSGRRSHRWTVNSSNVTYLTLQTVRNATGYETRSTLIENVANPIFVDEAHHDYTLKSDTRARNTGDPLPGYLARAIGVLPNVAVNVGALVPTET